MDEDVIIKPSIRINPTKVSYVPSVPKGFTIYIDTREQMPYVFGDIPAVSHKLAFGDYSIKGFESDISIERKSQSDFYGSITSGRDRFKRMIERMEGVEFKGLIIECSEANLLTPELTYSNIHPNSIYSTIIAFEIKHRFHVYYGAREDCRIKVINWLVKYYNYKRLG